jgi:MFS family permease
MNTLGSPYSQIRPRTVAPDLRVTRSLAPEAIAEGARRLGWLGLFFAIGSILGPFARLVLSVAKGNVEAPDVGVPDAFGVAAVVMGLAVFAVVRRGMLPAGRPRFPSICGRAVSRTGGGNCIHRSSDHASDSRYR